MGAMASQITSLAIFCSTVYSGADQRKHQSSASLTFVRGIHRGLVNSPNKWPVTRKMFPFDDVIMKCFMTTFPVATVRPHSAVSMCNTGIPGTMVMTNMVAINHKNTNTFDRFSPAR